MFEECRDGFIVIESRPCLEMRTVTYLRATTVLQLLRERFVLLMLSIRVLPAVL
jgi:hypothetical protein